MNEKLILEKLDKLESMINQVNNTWLTVKQCSDYINLSESQIRKLIARNEIPFNKASGKILMNRKALDLWLLSNSQKTTFSKRDRQKLEVIL